MMIEMWRKVVDAMKRMMAWYAMRWRWCWAGTEKVCASREGMRKGSLLRCISLRGIDLSSTYVEERCENIEEKWWKNRVRGQLWAIWEAGGFLEWKDIRGFLGHPAQSRTSCEFVDAKRTRCCIEDGKRVRVQHAHAQNYQLRVVKQRARHPFAMPVSLS